MQIFLNTYYHVYSLQLVESTDTEQRVRRAYYEGIGRFLIVQGWFP